MSQPNRQPCTCSCGCTRPTRRSERQPDGTRRILCGPCREAGHEPRAPEPTSQVHTEVESRVPVAIGDLDTRTVRMSAPRPPSPAAVLARHGIATPPPGPVARDILRAYGALPAWLDACVPDMSEPDDETFIEAPANRGWVWPEGVPTAAEQIDPQPVPSRTRPTGMLEWHPVGLRRRMGMFVGRYTWTVRLYWARLHRRLDDGGDRCRMSTSTWRMA